MRPGALHLFAIDAGARACIRPAHNAALGLDEAVRRHVVFLRRCGEMLRALRAIDKAVLRPVRQHELVSK